VRKIAKTRRALATAAGLAACLAAVFALGPASASGATIDQMAAQGIISSGSVACVGPFSAGHLQANGVTTWSCGICGTS
jgi:hypothetical protein